MTTCTAVFQQDYDGMQRVPLAVCVCVCVHMHARACVCVCAHMCVCVCVCAAYLEGSAEDSVTCVSAHRVGCVVAQPQDRESLGGRGRGREGGREGGGEGGREGEQREGRNRVKEREREV